VPAAQTEAVKQKDQNEVANVAAKKIASFKFPYYSCRHQGTSMIRDHVRGDRHA